MRDASYERSPLLCSEDSYCESFPAVVLYLQEVHAAGGLRASQR